jgi:hypothetical protein
MLGCYNDREYQLRKMAKLTALRLADKPKKKEEEKTQERKGRSLMANTTQQKTNTSTTATIGRNIPSNNKVLDQSVKLPKVPNSSTKNIEVKKPAEGIFRITNSKESRR